MLAAELAVSRSTVTDAYERLAAEGYVEGRRGGGTVVVGGTLPRPSNHEPSQSEVVPALDAATIGRYGPSPVARYDLTAGRVYPACSRRRTGDVASCMRFARADAVGRYGDPVGSPALRRAVTHWIAHTRGIATPPDRVVDTHGTGQTINLLGRVLLRPGDVAAVEESGYPPVTSVLRSQGIEVVGVPVDEDGLVVEALPPDARLVHVTPSHHYPLRQRAEPRAQVGASGLGPQTPGRGHRGRLRQRPAVRPTPVEPLHHLDSEGRIVYAATFSKILSPSLRMAFAVLPPSLVPAGRAAPGDRRRTPRHARRRADTVHRRGTPGTPPAPQPQDLPGTPPDGHA